MDKKKALLQKLTAELTEYRPNPHWDTTELVMNLLTENYALMSAFYVALEKAELSQELADVLCYRESLLENMVVYRNDRVIYRNNQDETNMNEQDITTITNDFLAETWREYRHGILCERLAENYEVFREELLALSKEEIIEKAYPIASRDDIVMLIDTHRFELPDIETLLTLENPLEEIYLSWLDCDGPGMDDLFTCVDGVIIAQREYLAGLIQSESENQCEYDEDDELER